MRTCARDPFDTMVNETGKVKNLFYFIMMGWEALCLGTGMSEARAGVKYDDQGEAGRMKVVTEYLHGKRAGVSN